MLERDMNAEQHELLDLISDISDRSFSCGWYCHLADVVRAMVSGVPWDKNPGVGDPDCCLPPPREACVRIGYLVGTLGGFWDSRGSGNYFWVPFAPPPPPPWPPPDGG